MPQPQYQNPKFSISRRISQAKVKAFSLTANFNLGYRNREDKTKLPAGVLIDGSQNVLTDVFNRVGITKGYVRDGQTANQNFLLWEDEVAGRGYLLLEDGGKIILNF